MANNRKLVAILACRNNSNRLYGKPLQNLDPPNDQSVLDLIIKTLRYHKEISEIALAISEGEDNLCFNSFANKLGLRWTTGSQINVLSRLVDCGKYCGATDILRITSESPFPHLKILSQAWNLHITKDNDATFLEEIIDGCGFEILSLRALEISDKYGSERHKSELCSLYIRENLNQFKIDKIIPEAIFIRKDLRLTIDYPEDLIVCRAIFKKFKSCAPNFSLGEIIKFLDENPKLKELIQPYAQQGYETMYL